MADSSENAELRLFGHTVFATSKSLVFKKKKKLLTCKIDFYRTIPPKYGIVRFKTPYVYTKSSSLALSVCGAQ